MSDDPRGGVKRFGNKIKQWKKGQSGNPKGGRPRATLNYIKELGEQLTSVDPKDPLGRTNIEIIVAKQIELAKMGSVRAVGEILDRLLGKPAQALNVAGSLSLQSREERVANILESLQALVPLLGMENGPGDPRIN